MKTALWMMVILAFSLSGCSSTPKAAFDVDARRVTIITEPEGASVIQINPFSQTPTSLGQTPITDRSVMVVSKITKMKNLPYHETKNLMEQVGNVVVRIEKDGYETYTGTLKTSPTETVVHTIQLHTKSTQSQ